MADGAGASFRELLDGLVGKPLGAGRPVPGPDPVNQPMIRHWAAAFDDHNPVYTDAEAAGRSRFGQIVAPPMMLQTWTLPTPALTGIAERGGAPTEQKEDSPLVVLDAAGYPGTRACDSEFAIDRYLHLGEVVWASNVLEAISAEKQTRLGPGFFVTWVTTFTDGAGAVVGRQRFRVLKFRPVGGEAPLQAPPGPPPTSPPGPAPVATPVATPARHPVRPGAALPTLEVAVTATRIVAGAIATRDFMPVHHDRDYAQAQGSPDIFLNILSTNAYAGRYLTDWAGPDSMIKRVSIRLGAPVFPGTTLCFTGSVSAVTVAGDEQLVDVAFSGATGLGVAATATALLSLPAAPA